MQTVVLPSICRPSWGRPAPLWILQFHVDCYLLAATVIFARFGGHRNSRVPMQMPPYKIILQATILLAIVEYLNVLEDVIT